MRGTHNYYIFKHTNSIQIQEYEEIREPVRIIRKKKINKYNKFKITHGNYLIHKE